MVMYHQSKFGCQGINSSEDIKERVTFWLNEPLLHDFDQENSKLIFLYALQLMVMHHNTKFG